MGLLRVFSGLGFAATLVACAPAAMLPDKPTAKSQEAALIKASQSLESGAAFEEASLGLGYTCARFACSKGCGLSDLSRDERPDEVLHCTWAETPEYTGGLSFTAEARAYLLEGKIVHKVHTQDMVR